MLYSRREPLHLPDLMKRVSQFYLVCAALASACSAHAVETKRSPARPDGNPGTWVSPGDYPKAELNNGVTGKVGFRLSIDPDGRVTKCEITQSSGSTALDETACAKLTERGRFIPAKDDDGRSVAGVYSNVVAWTIPGEMPAPPPGYMVFAFTVELDGTVTDCTVERAEGAAASVTSEQTCARFAKFRPFVDENGEPVRRRVRTMTRTVHEPLP